MYVRIYPGMGKIFICTIIVLIFLQFVIWTRLETLFAKRTKTFQNVDLILETAAFNSVSYRLYAMLQLEYHFCHVQFSFLYTIIKVQTNFFFQTFNFSDCINTKEVGDGVCNDENNNYICNFDAGDCCGPNAALWICNDCTCVWERTTYPVLTTRYSSTYLF